MKDGFISKIVQKSEDSSKKMYLVPNNDSKLGKIEQNQRNLVEAKEMHIEEQSNNLITCKRR
jgi:hypothetical protein